MTCNELTEFLLDYLSGDLPEDVRTTFEAHLGVCHDCRNYLDSYRKTIAMSQQMKVVDVEAIPEALVAAIMKARKAQPAS
jgi:predicted anti-sigma-YlaC factor YlaD